MRDQERNWISQHQRSAFTKTFRNFALACWIREVIQQKILSGQYQDSQRAAVSIRLFLKGKLYGEFTGLNNFYKIKITSNTLCLYNYETKSRSIFELKDSIPNLLFFPYNNKDSLSSGDIFYFNRCQ